MIDHELGDDADATGMGRTHELPEIGKRAILRMNVAIVANVITVIQSRRRIEWQKPDGVDAEIADVVELGYQSREIADAIVVAVKQRSHMQLIDHLVLLPELIPRDSPTSFVF